MTNNVAPIIAQHYLFSALNENEREYLIKDSTRQQFSGDSILFQKGEVATRFYLILQGTVRIYFATPDGREKTIRTFSAPNSFAEAVMFMHNDTYPANAATVDDCELLVIHIASFRTLLEKRPALYSSIIGHLIHHIQILNGQLEMLSVMDTKGRLLKYIDHQLPPNWQNKSTYPIRKSKKDLADYLAMRPETLSRTLKSIEKDGTLIWGKDGVTLLNWPPKDGS